MKKRWKLGLNIPEKANRILNGVLVILILILVRVWHLGVIQHEEKVEASKRPQTREVVERAERATIRDRFGKILATNKVQYNAAVSYGEIRDIPRWVWRRDESGKRVKRFERRDYISALAGSLGEMLALDGERLEDLIHSKASIFGSAPFVIKENISEREYFRLKMMEKDWPGVRAELVSRRWYPMEKAGCEVVGYMGAISRGEYEAVTSEMQLLREQLARGEEGEELEWAEERLGELESKAYTINDYVGKAGVEGAFDAQLRGACGRRRYLSDTRGNFVRELPGGKEAEAGKQLRLAISSELQAYAEGLLVEYEQAPISQRPLAKRWQALIPASQPWMRGGAIVAMDPNNGEIVALASFPRFDPNDFIHSGDREEDETKNAKINRWLENEGYLAAIWDGKQSLERERFDLFEGGFFEESEELSWARYLDLILPKASPVRLALNQFHTIGEAIRLQQIVEELVKWFDPIPAAKVVDFIYEGGEDVACGVTITLQEREFLQAKAEELSPQVESLKRALKPYFDRLPLNYEKLLMTDLCRLVVDPERFSPFLLQLLENQSLADFREASARMVFVSDIVEKITREIFHENDFKQWRETEFKKYLAARRKEEVAAKRKYGRPFIDYLDGAEKDQFQQFWSQYRYPLIAFFLTGKSPKLQEPQMQPYLEGLQMWEGELTAGAHTGLDWVNSYHRLKEMINELNDGIVVAYLKTLRRYDDLSRPLLGVYSGMRRTDGQQLEKHLATAFYPTYGYGYGRSQAFRQATTIGSIFKLIPAYEALRQRHINGRTLNPLTIVDDKHRTASQGGWNVGFTPEGKPIPMFYRGGRLLRSEHAHVGRVDLTRAIEASSNPYFSLLAGDILEDPEDLCHAARIFGFGQRTNIALPGEIRGNIPEDVAYNRTGLYALACGQHTLVGTPLQTAVMLSTLANGGQVLRPQIIAEAPKEVCWEIFLPQEIRSQLLKGMQQVIMGEKGTARDIRRTVPPELLTKLAGKTSTAEAVESMSLDGTSGRLKSKHIWFGLISFKDDQLTQPELVVVVYLRLGEFGRLAAPLAVKTLQKWQAINIL